MTRRRAAMGLGFLLLAAGPGCEGSGSGGDGLRVRAVPSVPFCTPAPGIFPSGLDILSQESGLAAMAQFNPGAVVAYRLDAERPVTLRSDEIGADSDGDGEDDTVAMQRIGRFPLAPVMGELQAFRDDLALLSTSNYEQVLVYDPSTPTPVEVLVETPAAVPEGRYPLLPPPGTAEVRTGVSTLACVAPDHPFDSSDTAIDPGCDPTLPSFTTNLTAGKTLAAGRLFVATSNLHPRGGARFLPGTLLVYEWIDDDGAITVRPDPDAPVLFTSDVGAPGARAGFNPTGVARHETASGRELVLVTITGAIGAGNGDGNVVTDAEIQVIDPLVPRIAARIPLGPAGPSFAGLAIEPGGRVGWLGASSQLQIYAVDLRGLDDRALYADPESPPALLDGSDPRFPDARIFTGDAPLRLPDRPSGPPPRDCAGLTHVAVNASGSDVFATDFCDGTFTRVAMDLSGSPSIPYPASRFRVIGQSRPFAPLGVLGEVRSPSLLAVRPGEPGVDYTAPDVLVVAGQPDAQLCALRVESFEDDASGP